MLQFICSLARISFEGKQVTLEEYILSEAKKTGVSYAQAQETLKSRLVVCRYCKKAHILPPRKDGKRRHYFSSCPDCKAEWVSIEYES